MNELERLRSERDAVSQWAVSMKARLVDREGADEYNDMHDRLIQCHAIMIAYQDRIIELENMKQPEPEKFVGMSIIKGGRE